MSYAEVWAALDARVRAELAPQLQRLGWTLVLGFGRSWHAIPDDSRRHLGMRATAPTPDALLAEVREVESRHSEAFAEAPEGDLP